MDMGWIVTSAAPGNPTAQIDVTCPAASGPCGPTSRFFVRDPNGAVLNILSHT